MGDLVVGRIEQLTSHSGSLTGDLARIRAHWNSRASLGVTAGTQDLILKQLEQRAILAEIAGVAYHKGNGRGLEIGCGRGETATRVALHYRAKQIVAVDNSSAMIAEAKAATLGAVPNLTFAEGDALNPPAGPFDVIYTQRCLINLPTWELQKQAIDAIADRLVSGGRFMMVEHSYDCLCWLNNTRAAFGLPAIEPPFHNRYFRDEELETIDSLQWLRCDPFSARYYYHSRVINAWIATQEGREPDYNAPVNRMALETDAPFDGRYAQGRMWVWEKP